MLRPHLDFFGQSLLMSDANFFITSSMALKTCITCLLAVLGITCFHASASETDTRDAYPCDGANYALYSAERPPLLPMPRSIAWKDRSSALATVTIQTPQQTADPAQMKHILAELNAYLKAHEIKTAPSGAYPIRFTLIPEWPKSMENREQPPALGDDSYRMSITPQGIDIQAVNTRGFYYGLQTLKQLILRRGGKTTVAHCSIEDWGAFPIRGAMNDIGRNYMPMDMLYGIIDKMAALKLNTYHFHCTENEGWRLESKLYLSLTEAKNMTRFPGKHYTQEEFRRFVEYCRVRNIMVIPEMDMPGHSASLRRAFGISAMNDPRMTRILTDLIKELCSLVPAETMPYIHIGTDEAHGKEEQVDNATLTAYFRTVEKCGRKPVRWHPGLAPKGYKGAVQQLWTERTLKRCWPAPGGEYIDSIETYLNHIDPFTVASTMYFRRICPFPQSKGLGMILCSWPDLPMNASEEHLTHNQFYSGIAFVSEPMWNPPFPRVEGDPMKDSHMQYHANLPAREDPMLAKFAAYENRVLAIRDRFFRNTPFHYVRQAQIPWKIIGPFPHEGNVDRIFPPENLLRTGNIEPQYEHNGKTWAWHPQTYTGATVIFKQYCDFPTPFNGQKPGARAAQNSTYYAYTCIHSPKAQKVPFWIGAHTWATSDWRNGPVSVPGKWYHSNPRFWVNGKEIPPPAWKKPGNNGAMIDENYHFRAPVSIDLKKGWNLIFIKSPNNPDTRRWMFTFVPVQWDPQHPGCNIREYPGLEYSIDPAASLQDEKQQHPATKTTHK